MCVESGYKTITPVQLCNGLSALAAGTIGFRAFRVYVACFAIVAAREAADRARKAGGRRGGVMRRYRIEELQRLVGEGSGRKVRGDLARLGRAGLLAFRETEIRIAETPLPSAEDILEVAAGARSSTRPIPVPRSVLRFLARCTKPALAKAVVAYLIRGLSIDRRTGEIRSRGSVKLSWIEAAAGISERAARYARAELVHLGWIGRDRGSLQRKLNRDGAYFQIDLAWRCPPRGAPARADGGRSAGEEGISGTAPRTGIAPRGAEDVRRFAPPRERPETPNGSKYQRTRGADPAGVFSKPSEGRPTLRSIRREDLGSCSRMEELYWQAVGKGIIGHSDSAALNWLAAAIRANGVRDGDPVRIFVGIVRRRLWSHITQVQEERARQALAQFREVDPGRFRERRAA